MVQTYEVLDERQNIQSVSLWCNMTRRYREFTRAPLFIWLELGIAPEETGREIRHVTMNLF
jgi:hypothetical protein